MKWFKQFFCRHHWTCIYIYKITALWRCSKCSKQKMGFAPVLMTNKDLIE
jgi:hypothetical protein